MGQLPVDRAVQITKEIADALEYAHALGVIHRDVKPANILLSGGHAVLADFGIAKALTSVSADSLTEAGISMGTAQYMSPEQAAGDQVLDVRTDIYSLGAVLYEMLVGQPPFDGQTAQVVLGKILTLRPTRPSDVREAIPDALDGAIMRALSRLPSDRFSFAEHFSEALVTMDRRQGAVHVKRRPAIGRIVAALAVVAIAWSAWTTFYGPSDARTIDVPRPSPFLTDAALLSEPAWSPAANLIAYVSDQEGEEDIWVVDASGMNPINLTGGSGFTDVHPAWSPDGNKIAFVSNRDGGGLYTMSALGGGISRLAPVVFDGSTASSWVALQWATDGTIVYTSRDATGAPQVYGIREDLREPDCLTCDLVPGAGQSGHLLPGGTLLVFRSTHGPEPDGELYIADFSTGETQTIARDVALPKWSEDLNRLLYVSVSDGGFDLWAMEIDLEDGRVQGTPQRLTTGFDVAGLAIGPSGRVLVARQRTTSTLWSLPIDGGPLGGLDRADQLTESAEFRDGWPRWISESDVVFQSDRRGSLDLWLLEATSGRLTRLTAEPGAEGSPHPSSNGSLIAYEHAIQGVPMIRTMRGTEGSGVSPDPSWADRFQDQCCPSWSPDGRRLAMAVTVGPEGRRFAIADVDPLTGSSPSIT